MIRNALALPLLCSTLLAVGGCNGDTKPTVPATPPQSAAVPPQQPATPPQQPAVPATPPAVKAEDKKPAEATKPEVKVEPKVEPKPEEKKSDPVPPSTPPTPPQSTPPSTPPGNPASTPPAAAAGKSPARLNPALATEKAPDKFKAKVSTTKGDFTIEVTREWSPNGADRFYNLVKAGLLDDVAFFRNIQGFMVQFGINGDPEVNKVWKEANIPDDPVKGSNTRGFVTFAKTGLPNSRSTQIFINFGNNANLDRMGFSPFGQITEGMEVVDSLYNGYGEGAPRGRGPNQMRIQGEGNAYLKQDFPQLDYIKTATLLP